MGSLNTLVRAAMDAVAESAAMMGDYILRHLNGLFA